MTRNEIAHIRVKAIRFRQSLINDRPDGGKAATAIGAAAEAFINCSWRLWAAFSIK
jgi:hypothetical protein